MTTLRQTNLRKLQELNAEIQRFEIEMREMEEVRRCVRRGFKARSLRFGPRRACDAITRRLPEPSARHQDSFNAEQGRRVTACDPKTSGIRQSRKPFVSVAKCGKALSLQNTSFCFDGALRFSVDG